jgi:hypothetical protein
LITGWFQFWFSNGWYHSIYGPVGLLILVSAVLINKNIFLLDIKGSRLALPFENWTGTRMVAEYWTIQVKDTFP